MADTESPQESGQDKSRETQKPLSENKFRFSETIWLAAASAGAYLFAFYYEKGYVSYFGIPVQFVNVSLINLLIFGAIALSFIYSSLLFFNGVFPYITPKHPYLAFYVPRTVVLSFLVVGVPMVLFGLEKWWLWTISLGMIVMLSFIFLGIPLITHRKKGGWIERYNAELENEQKSGPNLYGLISSKYGVANSGLIISLLVICSGLVEQAGEAEALKQRSFLVTNTTPAMVVLRVYGDNMICAPFDRSTHEVKKSFSILKLAEDPKLIMNIETVGPLKPVEKLTPESVPQPTSEGSISPSP